MKLFASSATTAAVALTAAWISGSRPKVADARLVFAATERGAAAASEGRVVARERRDLGSEEECSFYPEIVFVQDVSDSYSEALVNLQGLMPEFFSYLETQFGGKVRVGIATFVDKPLENFGFDVDYCFDVKLKLTSVTEAHVAEEAQSIFAGLVAGGGNDWLEGGNLGLYRAAASDSIGWSNEVDIDGNEPVRLVILATDAATHVAGYHAKQLGYNLDVANFSEDNSLLNASDNALCDKIDYPTGEEINAVLTKRGIFPVILAARPTYSIGSDEYVYPDLLTLEDMFGHTGEWSDVHDGLVNYYQWFLSEYVGVDGSVTYMDRNSESFLEVIDSVLSEARHYHCDVKPSKSSSTTTTTPTDSATTATNETTESASTATSETSESSSTATSETSESSSTATSETAESTTTESTTTTTTTESTTTTTTAESTTTTTTAESTTTTTTAESTTTTTTAESTTTTTTGSSSSGAATTTPPSYPDTTTSGGTTAAAAAGGSKTTVIAIAAAAGGVPVAVLAGLGVMKGMGVFNRVQPADVQVGEDAEHNELPEEREQHTTVTSDLFA